MKLKKGQWLYLITTLILAFLLFQDNSGALFHRRIVDVLEEATLWVYATDLLGIAVLFLLGLFLNIWYKKHSIYRKIYWVYCLVVLAVWTGLS